MLIDRTMLSELSAEAAASPRRRKNRNFHASDAAPANRLLNAVCQDSYVRPHRHLDPGKDETIIALAGSFGLLMFDDVGQVVSTAVIAARGDAVGANIPHGRYHSLVALEPGSVFFEAKAGPYVPIAEDEKAPWAPAEGSSEAPAFLASMRARF